MLLTRVIDAQLKNTIPVTGGQDGHRRATPLELSQRILPTGEVVANIGGELDIATADEAVSYFRQIIDRHCGPAWTASCWPAAVTSKGSWRCRE